MSITLQFFPVVSENSLYFSELTHKYRVNLKINDFEGNDVTLKVDTNR